VDRVSFHVAANIITGIIGPNGAGKTTLFNIISGLYAQDEGTVHLLDHDLSSLPPEKRVRLGIVRTFQNLELFGRMTVWENVMVGRHVKSSAGLLACAFRLPRERLEESAIQASAHHWLEFCGLTDVATQEAANLPLGRGRILEIARAWRQSPR